MTRRGSLANATPGRGFDRSATSSLVYGSVCSGVEAASVAWEPLGWRASFFSEIEPFPRAVLGHHFPKVPLHGDFTTIQAGQYEPIDLLVGGTPCQSFSVAGLRGGLGDDRGNLALEYLRLADRLRPRWLVWENVPGVLSSNRGRDFGAILGGLVELGYGFAYRILDAQHFGVPQRRRRVFVVGYLGDWRAAAAVLFERQSLRGDSPPRRQAREGIAGTLAGGAFSGGACGGSENADSGRCVSANLAGGGRSRGGYSYDDIPLTRAFGGNNTAGAIDCATALSAHGGPHGRQDFESETFVVAPPLTGNPYGDHQSREGIVVAHALRGEGFDTSEDGTGRGTPIIPVCIHADAIDRSGVASTPSRSAQGKERLRHPGDGILQDGGAYSLMASGKPHAVAFDLRGREGGAQLEGPHDTANIRAAEGGSSRSYLAFNSRQDPCFGPVTGALDRAHPQTQAVSGQSGVRRLTPLECERLQGFPDGWTDVPYRRRNHTPDGPRYKAMGNSMAVPVMRWIGQRIAAVEAILQARRGT